MGSACSNSKAASDIHDNVSSNGRNNTGESWPKTNNKKLQQRSSGAGGKSIIYEGVSTINEENQSENTASATQNLKKGSIDINQTLANMAQQGRFSSTTAAESNAESTNNTRTLAEDGGRRPASFYINNGGKSQISTKSGLNNGNNHSPSIIPQQNSTTEANNNNNNNAMFSSSTITNQSLVSAISHQQQQQKALPPKAAVGVSPTTTANTAALKSPTAAIEETDNEQRRIEILSASHRMQSVTPAIVKIIRETWALAMKRSDFAVAFYNDLLTKHRSATEAIFYGVDIVQQASRLVKMIEGAINLLENPKSLVPVIIRLGSRHVSYGTTSQHFILVTNSLIDLILETVGPEIVTPTVVGYWHLVLGLFQQIMEAGYSTDAGKAVGKRHHARVQRTLLKCWKSTLSGLEKQLKQAGGSAPLPNIQNIIDSVNDNNNNNNNNNRHGSANGKEARMNVNNPKTYQSLFFGVPATITEAMIAQGIQQYIANGGDIGKRKNNNNNNLNNKGSFAFSKHNAVKSQNGAAQQQQQQATTMAIHGINMYRSVHGNNNGNNSSSHYPSGRVSPLVNTHRVPSGVEAADGAEGSGSARMQGRAVSAASFTPNDEDNPMLFAASERIDVAASAQQILGGSGGNNNNNNNNNNNFISTNSRLQHAHTQSSDGPPTSLSGHNQHDSTAGAQHGYTSNVIGADNYDNNNNDNNINNPNSVLMRHRDHSSTSLATTHMAGSTTNLLNDSTSAFPTQDGGGGMRRPPPLVLGAGMLMGGGHGVVGAAEGSVFVGGRDALGTRDNSRAPVGGLGDDDDENDMMGAKDEMEEVVAEEAVHVSPGFPMNHLLAPPISSSALTALSKLPPHEFERLITEAFEHGISRLEEDKAFFGCNKNNNNNNNNSNSNSKSSSQLPPPTAERSEQLFNRLQLTGRLLYSPSYGLQKGDLESFNASFVKSALFFASPEWNNPFVRDQLARFWMRFVSYMAVKE